MGEELFREQSVKEASSMGTACTRSPAHLAKGGRASVQGRHLMIVTPVVPPAPGGGAVYSMLLAEGLVKRGIVERVTIITERYPGSPKEERLDEGRIVIMRKFPFRAGRTHAGVGAYVRYAYQNLQFLGISRLVDRLDVSDLMVHGSFHNNPGLIGFSVRRVRKNAKCRVIADIRDPKLPRGRFNALNTYHAVIACSRNIMEHLGHEEMLREKLVHIPIIVEVTEPTRDEIARCCQKYGVTRGGYIFNSSGISKEKGADALLEVVRRLRNEGVESELVIAGRRRDWARQHNVAERQGILKYLGVIPHEDILCLSAGALADVNLSRVDSMPRGSLEALAVGANVIFPKGIPELEGDARACVVDPGDISQVTNMIVGMREGRPRCSYNIGAHKSEHVIPLYNGVLGRQDKRYAIPGSLANA